jgi:glycosyltransferase involved in cell wall biosynthesis
MPLRILSITSRSDVPKESIEMKIAVYHNLMFGGAQRALQEYIVYLSKDNTVDVYQINHETSKDCEIFSSINKNMNYAFKPFLGKYFSNPYLYTPAIIFDIFRMIPLAKKIAKVINKGNYDWVFIHHDRWIQNPLVTKYIRLPKIVYCQEPFRAFYEPVFDIDKKIPAKLLVGHYVLKIFHLILERVSKIGINNAEIVFTNSCYSREYIYKVYKKWSFVSYLGVDINKYKKINIKKENIVLSIGLINWKKKHDLVIQSIAAINNEMRPKLVLITPTIGNAKERKCLLELARERCVQVEIIVGITNDNLVQYYNRAITVVCCSIMEPFGLVPLEAMACGTPVIAVNEGGYRETIKNNLTGFLANRDPNEIAEKIEFLINNPKKYNEMSMSSMHHVSTEWSWESRFPSFQEKVHKHLKLSI